MTVAILLSVGAFAALGILGWFAYMSASCKSENKQCGSCSCGGKK